MPEKGRERSSAVLTTRLAFWLALVVGLAADLLSKRLVFQWLGSKPIPRHVLLGKWLVIELHRNTGGVFGLLPGRGYVFVALSVVALGVVVWLLRGARPGQVLYPLALGLVGAGALGNLFDRLAFGYVRDFIYVEIIRWPAFNVADTCICVAAGLLVLEMFRGGEHGKEVSG